MPKYALVRFGLSCGTQTNGASLCDQVRRVAKTLAQQATEVRAQVDNRSFDAKFVLPGQSSAAPTTDATSASSAPALETSAFMRDAIELVVDYVPADVADLLYQELKYVTTQSPRGRI